MSIEANYLEAGIELIAEGSVPTVTVAELKAAYPAAADRLDDLVFRREMGIGEGDRWPVVLAGYVVNALNRAADAIRQAPYEPAPGDAFFPPRPPPVANVART